MRWWITSEARSAELAIIISYSTSASGITVLLKTEEGRTGGVPINPVQIVQVSVVSQLII